ncbi:hypothetical protein LGK97_13855 [Clostridium sp. CS001]|uniref:hypothetical protein n=1 Tax=Clostridium sp. CS001 TaxID=2880648 RepID=UPI001CF0DB7C|nr:hypothetical protein [Clostridium sp. CS001]MCB2290826.1 hypothetical protein [Clostridium sp. CS001]
MKENVIKIELKGREVEISIFYSFCSYKIYQKILSETNDYKEAFFNSIYEMISINKDSIEVDDFRIEDVKEIKVEYLDMIAEYIINSSGLREELNENGEFNNGDCFRKIYLMNKKLVINNSTNLSERGIYSQTECAVNICSQYLNRVNKFEDLVSPGMKSLMGLSSQMGKIINPINAVTKLSLVGVQRDIRQLAVTSNALSNRSLRPLKPVLQSGLLNIQRNDSKNVLGIGVAHVESVGKIYSQYLNRQNKIGDLISPSMKSLVGLSGQMEKTMTPINAVTKLSLSGVQSDIRQLAVTSNALINRSFGGITTQLQKQLGPLGAGSQLGLLNIQKNIPKVGLEIGFASQVLKSQNIRYDKIISNISSTKEALMSSNIESIRSALLGSQVGTRLLESQLKGVKESLSLVTKFDYSDKLISFDSLNKSMINAIRPFITDFNSLILSRNNIRESIKSKAMSLNNFDWWLISSLPIIKINEIYRNKESLNIDEVDNIICDYYSDNNFKELDKVTEKWVDLDYFNNRIDILKESIEVHKLEKYRLTVPTLVPLIEGVIRDFMLDKYKILNESFSPTYKIFKSKVNELSNFIVNYVVICIDKLYCRFNPTKPNEVSDFSRHKISHGLAIEYGSEANSLKVILFLDEIFEIISSIQEMKLIEVS